ncbi:MAG TPA: hypothetical protein VJ770_23145 [Stellaceae bacterium]|nr:hypothetical protein [Stellaceae bacterium]
MLKSPGISDLDIWRAANLLIRQYGADAEIEAARRADQMLDRGDRPFDRLRRAACVDAYQASDRGTAGPAARLAPLK